MTYCNKQQFERNLDMGKKFEDQVEPIINRYFAYLDPNSYVMNKAYSKKDIMHQRGQRYKLCANTSISYCAPDIEIHCRGKQLHIEIKFKNSWVNIDGKEYAVIDEYKVREYENVLKLSGFDECLYVFGSAREGKVYITNARENEKNKMVRIRKTISYFKTDRKNPNCSFYCWEVSKLKHIGNI